MINLIRSAIFWIALILFSVLIPVIYFGAYFTKNGKIADKGGYMWAKISLFFLKIICGVTHRVIGAENIPHGACIIASKHQSMWETIVMHLVISRPVYVFKIELLRIPFYGWFLRRMSSIAVDRSKGADALKKLIKSAKQFIERGQKILIFPQGTRVPIGAGTDKYPYQSGVAAIYKACDIEVVPTALNSGEIWKKNKIICDKIITVKFLKPIKPGLDKKKFLENLEEIIENESKSLLTYK